MQNKCCFLPKKLKYFQKVIQVLESTVDTEHVQSPKVWVDVRKNQKVSQL
jgi:hypothetical protein